MESAEQAAVSSPRDSTTSPRYYSSHEINRFTDDGKLTPGTRELLLSMNRHFDNLPVNLSMSAVLFPPGVEDSGLYFVFIFIRPYETHPLPHFIRQITLELLKRKINTINS